MRRRNPNGGGGGLEKTPRGFRPPLVEGSKLTAEQREEIAKGERAVVKYWEELRNQRKAKRMCGKQPSTHSNRTAGKYED